MKHKGLKITGIIIALIAAIFVFFDLRFHPATQFTWGIDYSPEYAVQLGLDPNKLFVDILADLKPKQMRLAAQWDSIEPQPGQYDFGLLDGYLRLAAQDNVQIMLDLGRKTPRWPECHEPSWVDALPAAGQQQAEMDMIKAAVNHFKDFPAITIWQVENEPEFHFNQACSTIPLSQLKAEVSLVKSLDSRPVLVSDSGELGLWLPTASSGADDFGTTMYRVVHNGVVGYWKYPLPTWFFHIKAAILETFFPQKQIIGVELQAEPWLVNGVNNTDLDTQRELMNPKMFQENVQYAESAGFSDNYLWGVEWWYWMAQKQNDWGMWTAAKNLLKSE